MAESSDNLSAAVVARLAGLRLPTATADAPAGGDAGSPYLFVGPAPDAPRPTGLIGMPGETLVPVAVTLRAADGDQLTALDGEGSYWSQRAGELLGYQGLEGVAQVRTCVPGVVEAARRDPAVPTLMSVRRVFWFVVRPEGR
jgi:hypothetical protein